MSGDHINHIGNFVFPYFTVTEFAKLTGDFKSLSVVDLRVLALTYQLEKEHCGTGHINTAPSKQVSCNVVNCPLSRFSY